MSEHIFCSTMRRADRTRRIKGIGAVVTPVLASAPVLAACGRGPSTPGVISSSSTTTTTLCAAAPGYRSSSASELLAYSNRMRTHGFPSFPDPTNQDVFALPSSVDTSSAIYIASFAGWETTTGVRGGNFQSSGSQGVPGNGR